jgi:hypothetical protein
MGTSDIELEREREGSKSVDLKMMERWIKEERFNDERRQTREKERERERERW